MPFILVPNSINPVTFLERMVGGALVDSKESLVYKASKLVYRVSMVCMKVKLVYRENTVGT